MVIECVCLPKRFSQKSHTTANNAEDPPPKLYHLLSCLPPAHGCGRHWDALLLSSTKRLTKFYLLSRSYLRSVFPLFKTNFVSCAQSGAHTGACESARQGAVTLICHQRKHGADRRHIVSVCHAATGKTKHFTLIFKKSVKAKSRGLNQLWFADFYVCQSLLMHHNQTNNVPARTWLTYYREASRLTVM